MKYFKKQKVFDEEFVDLDKIGQKQNHNHGNETTKQHKQNGNRVKNQVTNFIDAFNKATKGRTYIYETGKMLIPFRKTSEVQAKFNYGHVMAMNATSNDQQVANLFAGMDGPHLLPVPTKFILP